MELFSYRTFCLKDKHLGHNHCNKWKETPYTSRRRRYRKRNMYLYYRYTEWTILWINQYCIEWIVPILLGLMAHAIAKQDIAMKKALSSRKLFTYYFVPHSALSNSFNNTFSIDYLSVYFLTHSIMSIVRGSFNIFKIDCLDVCGRLGTYCSIECFEIWIVCWINLGSFYLNMKWNKLFVNQIHYYTIIFKLYTIK